LSVAKIECQSPIENQNDDVPGFVKVPDEVDVRLVQKKASPGRFKREPDDDRDEEVHEVPEQPLPEGCQ
jgi:hypothetical protein